MAWWIPKFWFGGLFGSQTNRELTALQHLKTILTVEEQEAQQLISHIVQMEKALAVHDYATAERITPTLIGIFKQKKKVDKREGADLKLFENTFLAELRGLLTKGNVK